MAFRGPRYVVIAADSKPTYRGEQGPATICKIYQSGSLYFAIAGLEHDRERNFYAKTIVANSFSSAVFPVAVENVKRVMKESLLRELLRMKTEDPDSYHWTLKDGGDILSVVLVEAQNEIPYVSGIGFQFADFPEPQITVSQMSCPGDDCPNGTLTLYLGRQSAAKRFACPSLYRSGPQPIF